MKKILVLCLFLSSCATKPEPIDPLDVLIDSKIEELSKSFTF